MKDVRCKACGGTDFFTAEVVFRSPELYAPAQHDLCFCVDCGTVRVEEAVRKNAFWNREEGKKRAKEHKLQRMCFMCEKDCMQNPECEKYQGAMWMFKEE